SVAVVNVDDIYDEFSFGEKTPWALKNYLTQASAQWPKPPRFVLLVGDATFDPRDFLGLGDSDLVPTRLVDTSFLETASDDWFADLDEDGVPELAMGRLPARTPEEASRMVDKIVGYEQTPPSGEWAGRALLISDGSDEFSDFGRASDGLQSLMPSDISVLRGFVSRDEMAGARRDLFARLNEGQLLVNYFGHGSVEVWGRGGLFSGEDAATLANGSKLPVVLSMTCLNGFFHDVYTESMAEALLKAGRGGAVAVWASSGLTTVPAQSDLDQAVLRLLFGNSFGNTPPTLGEAMARAKAATTDSDVRRSWMLFGDPATTLVPRVSGARKRRMP
ncbi:MAG: hypothetical protein HY315_10625, partial [Acidobacteria bacterium]|nr:hypothetical protein [Acidobacteriota bacterium]